jgi:hypothetical protein
MWNCSKLFHQFHLSEPTIQQHAHASNTQVKEIACDMNQKKHTAPLHYRTWSARLCLSSPPEIIIIIFWHDVQTVLHALHATCTLCR